MHITELSKDTGATVDQIRYLERKGYVQAEWKQLSKRKVRFYPESQVATIQSIMKYFNLGYRYDVAYRKTIEEVQKPRLL